MGDELGDGENVGYVLPEGRCIPIASETRKAEDVDFTIPDRSVC